LANVDVGLGPRCGIGGVRARRLQQRVAVGRRLPDALGADLASGARHVLDDHRLTQKLVHARLRDAHGRIGRSARRKRHDDLDRLAWECLGEGDPR
jgi:hypothetical protein